MRSTALDAGIFQEPLLAQVRLDRHVAALAVAHVVHVILGLQQQALLGQFFDHRLARLHAVQAVEILARLLGHRAVGADDDRQRQLVAQRHLVIVRVVGGRDFDAAGAELRVDEVVGDDGNRLVLQRQQAAPPDQVACNAGRPGSPPPLRRPASFRAGWWPRPRTRRALRLALGRPAAGYFRCQRCPSPRSSRLLRRRARSGRPDPS